MRVDYAIATATVSAAAAALSSNSTNVMMDVTASQTQTETLTQTLAQTYLYLSVAKVYDWTLTIDEEVALVWPSKWGWPKVLYVLNRYLVFADPALLIYVLIFGRDAKTCVVTFQTLGGTTAFGFVVAQIILAMRTWAVWARRRSVTVTLVVLIVAALSLDIYVLKRYLGGVSYVTLFTSSIDGCLLQFANRFVYVDFIDVIVLETAMLVLLVIKALEYFKHSRNSLMVRMLNDGVVYFVYIFITSVVNLCTIILAPVELHNMFIVTQRVFHSIFCTRVLLHIRGAYTNKMLLASGAGGGPGNGNGVATNDEQRCTGSGFGFGSGVGEGTSRNANFSFRHTWRSGIGIGINTNTGSGFGSGASPTDTNTFELVTSPSSTKRDSGVRFSGVGIGRAYGGEGDEDPAVWGLENVDEQEGEDEFYADPKNSNGSASRLRSGSGSGSFEA
ncbi:hypothetical protein M0805_009916 [Coniferiporia weirii]|nr:hypothetical protein M0805_009916 [Coniferiporia weirii]